MANTNKSLKELLAEVRLKLAEQSNAAPTPETETTPDVEIKGKDGKTYEAAKLEVGEAIQVQAEDGSLSPAQDGEIEVEDGSKITVKDGKIEAIKPADVQPTDEISPVPQNGGFKAEDFVSKEAFQALETKFNSALETIKQLSEGISKNKGQVNAMFAVVEAIANESEETPTDTSVHNNFSKQRSEKDSAKAKLKEAFDAAK
jgi:hypothetical protein